MEIHGKLFACERRKVLSAIGIFMVFFWDHYVVFDLVFVRLCLKGGH